MAEVRHSPTDLLNPRQLHAVEMLARGVSKAAIAREVRVDRSTIYEWMKQPTFSRELSHRRECLQRLINDPTPYLTGLAYWQEHLPEVMQGIVEVAKDPSHKNQLKAAELILEQLNPQQPVHAFSPDAQVIEAFAEQHGWDDAAE